MNTFRTGKIRFGPVVSAKRREAPPPNLKSLSNSERGKNYRTPLGAAAHIVDEYCRLFGHGAPVRLASFQWFLNAVMNDNVRFGKFLDVELLLNQWERYSLYHAAIEWTMKSLSVVQLAEPRVVTADNQYDDGPLVVSIKADLRVRFSRRTIEEVFPYLVGDEGLTQSLVGLEVTYPCINHFHFNERGKIEWYAPEVVP